jgi:hypothetical protein
VSLTKFYKEWNLLVIGNHILVVLFVRHIFFNQPFDVNVVYELMHGILLIFHASFSVIVRGRQGYHY